MHEHGLTTYEKGRMKKIEYKHVRQVWKFSEAISKKKFDSVLMQMLSEHGQNGWDLKGVIYEQRALHAHFIFGREAI